MNIAKYNAREEFLNGDINQPNPRFEGNLNDIQKARLNDFDWSIEYVIKTFFMNIELYEKEFMEIGVDVNRIDVPIVCSERKLTEQEEISINHSTHIAKTMFNCLTNYAEMVRNELNEALFEEMSDEDYIPTLKRMYRNAKKRTTEDR